MGKKKENTSIPDNAFKVREIRQWAVFWSNREKSFYFTSSAGPSSVLRLSSDELLTLAKEVEIQNPARKDAVAATSPVEEAATSISPRDRRGFKRFARHCEAEFTARGITRKGIGSDFSINGFFIRTTRPFAVDELINIRLHLPDNSLSSLQGKVIRAMNNSLGNITAAFAKTYKNGMGVKIIKKDATYLHFIRSLVK